MSQSNTREFVNLQVGHFMCAVDISSVHEITRLTNVTTVDQAPSFVAGIINLRGQVVTVVDLKSRLGLKEARSSDSAQAIYNVLVKSSDELIGLLVDNVDDIVSVATDTIRPAPPHVEPRLQPFFGEVVEIHNQVVAILAIDRITAADSDNS